MLKQSLEDEIENDTKDMDEEKSLKAATEEQQATLAERRKEARERWQSARERGFPEGEHMDNMLPLPER